jgi:hypothetical protein
MSLIPMSTEAIENFFKTAPNAHVAKVITYASQTYFAAKEKSRIPILTHKPSS